MYNTLNADENQLVTHISRWGSTGYPVHPVGSAWSWSFLTLNTPLLFRSKKAASQDFEEYHQSLLIRAGKSKAA